MAEELSAPTTHVYDLAVNYLQDGEAPVLKTGFTLLDRALKGGFAPGSIYIIGARPGTGKTSLALSIARRMALDYQRRVVFLSLEMTSAELLGRMVCQITRKTQELINTHRDDGSLPDVLKPFLALCHQAKFRLIDNRPAKVPDLGILFDEMQRVNEPLPEVLVIDHLQHQMFSEGLSRAEALANYMADLKTFAKKHNLVVIACSQINRQSKQEKSVQMHHLKSSGALEEVGDAVLLCEQDEPADVLLSLEEQGKPTEFYVTVSKHRRGPTSEFTLIFNKPLYDFDEPEGTWKPRSRNTKSGLDQTVVVVDE